MKDFIIVILIVPLCVYMFVKAFEPEPEEPVVDGLLLTEEQIREVYPGMNGE